MSAIAATDGDHALGLSIFPTHVTLALSVGFKHAIRLLVLSISTYFVLESLVLLVPGEHF